MKLLHTSDLHIGRQWNGVNGVSLLEDQDFILRQIENIAREQEVDAVIIAGDVYDRKIPSEDAINLFSQFITRLHLAEKKIFIISGNHDSEARLAFAAPIMKVANVYFSPAYEGKITPIKMEDDYGKINFWLLPFVKKNAIQHFFPEENLSTYDDAFEKLVSEMCIDTTERNILVAHQFILGAERSESEEQWIGGLDAISADIFMQKFDYVALGHLHRPQYVAAKNIRYSGSPIAYSFSEKNDKKSVTIVEIKQKNSLEKSMILLQPLHQILEIKGDFETITNPDFYREKQNAYVKITLTDDEEKHNAATKLAEIYPQMLSFGYDNQRTRKQSNPLEILQKKATINPLELFELLFFEQNGETMNEQQKNYITKVFKELCDLSD